MDRPGPKGPHKDHDMIKVQFNTRLPRWLVAKVKAHGKQSRTVERALIKELKLKPKG